MFKNKKGFSLVELIVIIAIMAVLIAILLPSLITYTERSRAQKDMSTLDELVNAFQLALSDEKCYDEAIKYSVENNFITYSDSSGVYGQQINDGEYWAPDGLGRATTFTFNPASGIDGNTIYHLNDGLVNDMTYGNGSVAQSRPMEGAQTQNNQCYFKNLTRLYNAVRLTIGDDVVTTSSTYKNSSFTVFIRFSQKDGVKVAEVYGAFNGTNLNGASQAAIGTNTTEYNPETGEPETSTGIPGTQEPEFMESNLSISGANVPTPDYKKEAVPPEITFNGVYSEDAANPTVVERGTVTLSGLVTDDGQIKSLTLNDCVIHVNADGTWTTTFDIAQNEELELSVVAKDDMGCTTTKTVYVKGVVFVDFTITQSNRHLIGFTDTTTDLVIPATFYHEQNKQWCRVVKIGDSINKYESGGAFTNCDKLKTVVMPDTISYIGSYAFSGCDYLTSVQLPNRGIQFGVYALSKCVRLNNIVIPEGTTSIQSYVFQDCSSLKNITLPSTLKTLGYMTFRGTAIVNIELPEGLTSIGSAFYWCDTLVSITIPSGVTTIDGSAFYSCDNLRSVTLNEGITSIGGGAFGSCRNLTTINIPSTVKTIGNKAFEWCSSLKTINIPSGVTSIGEKAFINCQALTSITIPNTVKTVGKYMFNNCKALKSITFEDGGTLATIPEGFAFQTYVTTITLPSSITKIDRLGFGSAGKLIFAGTMEEWSQVQLADKWSQNDYGKFIAQTHCSDGVYTN